MVECYFDQLVSRRAPQFIIGIVLSEYCVGTLISFFLSALIGGPVGFSSDFNGVEAIPAREVLHHLPKSAHRFMKPVRYFRTMSKFTVNRVKAFLAYSRSNEID